MGIGNALKTKDNSYELVLERGQKLLEDLASKDPKPVDNFIMVMTVNQTRPVQPSQIIGGIQKSVLREKISDPTFDQVMFIESLHELDKKRFMDLVNDEESPEEKDTQKLLEERCRWLLKELLIFQRKKTLTAFAKLTKQQHHDIKKIMGKEKQALSGESEGRAAMRNWTEKEVIKIAKKLQSIVGLIVTIDESDPHSNFYYDYKHALIIGNSDYSLLSSEGNCELPLVKENIKHFSDNTYNLLGFSENEVTILENTNWLATTSALLKLHSECAARKKLGLESLVIVYYAGHAVTSDDTLYMVFNTNVKNEQYLPLEEQLIGLSNHCLLIGIFDGGRMQLEDRSIPYQVNFDDHEISSALGQYYFLFSCRQDEYTPSLPQLTEEFFPALLQSAQVDPVFDMFECLDKGPFALYTVNHVTQKLMIQARKGPAGQTLTILQCDPVELQDEEERYFCEDCKGELTQEQFDDDECPRGDCPKNLRANIQRQLEEEKKQGQEVVPIVREGTYASDTVQKYYNKQKFCLYKSGVDGGIWKRKELGPFNYDKHRQKEDGKELEKKDPVELKNRLKEEYEGQWDLEGNRHGQGVELNHLGEIFEGFFSKGKKEGYGRLVYHNGAYYLGEFKDGLMHGNGTYVYPAGEKYEGEFVAGQIEGKGKLTKRNGAYYEGEWKASQKFGAGEERSKDGKLIRRGQWEYNDFVKK